MYVNEYFHLNICTYIGLCSTYDDRLVQNEASLRTGLSLVGLISLLEGPAGGFMSQEERISVDSERSDPEKVSKIVSILRKKTDKDYLKFCDILEKSGNEHWAKMLKHGHVLVDSSPPDVQQRTIRSVKPKNRMPRHVARYPQISLGGTRSCKFLIY